MISVKIYENLKQNVADFYRKYSGSVLRSIGGEIENFFILYYKSFVKAIDWKEYEKSIEERLSSSVLSEARKNFLTEDNWRKLQPESIEKRKYRAKKYRIKDKGKILSFSGNLSKHVLSSKVVLLPKPLFTAEELRVKINKKTDLYFQNPSTDKVPYDGGSSYYKVFAGHQFGLKPGLPKRPIISFLANYDSIHKGWTFDVNSSKFKSLISYATKISIPVDYNNLNVAVEALVNKIASRIDLSRVWKITNAVVDRRAVKMLLYDFVVNFRELDKDILALYDRIMKYILTKKDYSIIINIRTMYLSQKI